MSFTRIKALLLRHLYLYQRSMPRLMDIFFWPVLDLLVWGFLSAYLSQMNLANVNIVSVLLGAIIFWEFVNRAQASVSVSFLEDIWEKNLLNIFVSPLSISEFLSSSIILGFVRVSLVGIVMGILAFLFYSFNILSFGAALVPFVLNLIIFGFTLGLFTTIIILRFGTSAQVLAFGLIFLIQPFVAVFYPVSALPYFLQYVSYLLPPTYVFEGLRAVIETGAVPWNFVAYASIANIVYLAFMLWLFFKMFSWVKKKGLLLKLDY